ncbi:CDP-alcohol phosphatidyltransferase family protein [Rossellomorea vietnamensis]|uniref:CDP-alcohol phosphatidyltransferase family protein n=1 Tax=Rossellomorea vietnamensis TaxID=218284 RepID=A0A5D4MHY6_9BACI|nr:MULTISPECIES: CDP-alcohol phosphatidyltransferase family protein [Bacillaceae]TYS01178.1 CDP-alcohol phosphatidyltransferase family protein [Rossellomorea vietnamensis]
MLDTHARKYVQPFIGKTADVLLTWGLNANQVTTISFMIGVTSGFFIYFDFAVVAIIVLWFSGFLDAVDGSMARKTKSSAWGTLLDVSFDRLVEISVILGLAFRYPDSMWALLLLSVSIIYAMTIFLTVGALSEKKGIKSFYYQAGLAERTEGFILFSLMILLADYLTLFTLLFLFVEVFTTLQRLAEARRIMRDI